MELLKKNKGILLSEGKVVIRVKLRVGQARNSVKEIMSDGAVKIDIANIPEKGKANSELISFLAKEFDVSVKDVKIISGASSKLKLVKISRKVT